jgi:hypothetical protein
VIAQPPEAPQAKPTPPSVAVLIATYALLVVTAYMCFPFVAVLLGVRLSRTILMPVVALTILVLYVHLARSYPDQFLRVAIGSTVVGSALCSAVNSVAPGASSLKVVLMMLVINSTMVSLVGTLLGLGQLKPPANHRSRGP